MSYRPHLLFLALGSPALLNAQRDHRTTIEPDIAHITVYLNGGEARTSAELDLVAGRNTVVVKGLSPRLHPQSVQATIKGDLQILSVSSASNFLDAAKLHPRIGELRDSVELLQGRIADLEDRMAASQAEKDMLARNHHIGGDGVVVSAEQLAKAADFFRERTLAVNRAISKLQQEQRRMEEQLARTEQQLAELNYRHDPERKEVTIVLMAERAQRTRLDLRYLVANTGWAPIYDLAAKDNHGPITLRYKAQVYNNTGLDWKDVRLVLSTADPTLGARKPEMERWELNYAPARHSLIPPLQKDKRMEDAARGSNREQVIGNDPTQHYTTIAVSEVGAEFAIPRPYDIPSDAKPYLVDISEHALEATYSYMAVPKLDRDAFLLARVTGWQKLNLVDGKANVHYADSYVGESFISTTGADDTLDLSLGRDRNVQLERKLKEEMTTTRLIGSDRKETSTYEITVRNNGTAAVWIDVMDQVPVSQDSDIKVSVHELSGARLNAEEGSVTWKASLPPGGSAKYTLSYSIQYPKNKRPAAARRMRTISAPSF